MLLGWNHKWNKLLQILAMIEEAVGTMMYETKKQQCQKTIEKKDNKLREINEVSFTNSSKILTYDLAAFKVLIIKETWVVRAKKEFPNKNSTNV